MRQVQPCRPTEECDIRGRTALDGAQSPWLFPVHPAAPPLDVRARLRDRPDQEAFVQARPVGPGVLHRLCCSPESIHLALLVNEQETAPEVYLAKAESCYCSGFF